MKTALITFSLLGTAAAGSLRTQESLSGKVQNAPAKCMSARTGRTKDINQKHILGGRAHFTQANVANLQCCKDTDDGKKVVAKRQMYGKGGNYCNVIDAEGTKKDGGMKWVDAHNACANAPKDKGQKSHWRLCTDKEVLDDVGAYTGCNFDNKNVWTATKWADVSKADRATDWATKINKNICVEDFGECLKGQGIWSIPTTHAGILANNKEGEFNSCCEKYPSGMEGNPVKFAGEDYCKFHLGH
jgi:hypothetical protein